VNEPLVAYVSHDGPRLSRTDLTRGRLELFEHTHRASMSSPCLAFIRAQERMDTGAGVAKRAHAGTGGSAGTRDGLSGRRPGR
jgi:hypothetical protein